MSLRMSQNLACLALTAIFVLASSPSAQAGLVEWSFVATIDSQATDPLGIDGETVGFSVTFDDTQLWRAFQVFSFPSVSSSAFITGPHTIALNTPAPAASFIGFAAGMTQSLGSLSYVDFVIDGTQTQMLNFFSNPQFVHPFYLAPFLPDHLMQGVAPNAGFDSAGGETLEYLFLDPRITVSAVPEPGTFVLLGLGLAGLLKHARRRRHQAR